MFSDIVGLSSSGNHGRGPSDRQVSKRGPPLSQGVKGVKDLLPEQYHRFYQMIICLEYRRIFLLKEKRLSGLYSLR